MGLLPSKWRGKENRGAEQFKERRTSEDTLMIAQKILTSSVRHWSSTNRSDNFPRATRFTKQLEDQEKAKDLIEPQLLRVKRALSLERRDRNARKKQRKPSPHSAAQCRPRIAIARSRTAPRRRDLLPPLGRRRNGGLRPPPHSPFRINETRANRRTKGIVPGDGSRSKMRPASGRTETQSQRRTERKRKQKTEREKKPQTEQSKQRKRWIERGRGWEREYQPTRFDDWSHDGEGAGALKKATTWWWQQVSEELS